MAESRTITQALREQHELIKDLFDQLDTAKGAERQPTFDCLRATLAVHETAEEELVHPAVKRMGAGGADAVKARLAEEGTAKRMLSALEKIGPNHEEFQPLFDEFQSAVTEHAEAEEIEVFPFLDTMDDETLRTMADEMLVLQRMAPTHPHPHGPESALGNLLVGPFVAMVDKVRDAIARSRKAA